MAVWLYLIKVSQTLHQSLSLGLSEFDWPCLLPFNVKWQTEDMSFTFPLSFLRSCQWMEESRDERGRGQDDGGYGVNNTHLRIIYSASLLNLVYTNLDSWPTPTFSNLMLLRSLCLYTLHVNVVLQYKKSKFSLILITFPPLRFFLSQSQSVVCFFLCI